MNTSTRLPLDGVRVIEFTHMVMGPTCGMILATVTRGRIEAKRLRYLEIPAQGAVHETPSRFEGAPTKRARARVSLS